MAKTIDERVVSMAFENQVFEQRAAQTMATLGKLESAIKNIGQVQGLENIEKQGNKVTLAGPMGALDKLKARLGRAGDDAAKGLGEIERQGEKVTLAGPRAAVDKLQAKFNELHGGKAFAELEKSSEKVDLSGAHKAIDGVAAKFSSLQVAGVAAFATIASQATMQLAGVAKDLMGVKAILEGYSDYELKIGATQTIMAGTGENIQAVTKYLKELDIYADKTIYSLSDMVNNIGKFTNAGVKLPVAVDAMKGISNVAALAGASTENAAHSMYNFGQAIGQGHVAMRDWRSIEIANMATKNFKEELIKTAAEMGQLKKNSDGVLESTEGNIVNFKTFGSTLQDKWLTSDVLTKTLNKYADETTALGKSAYAAAMDVKTFKMMLTTLGAAAGTGWTDTFDIIIGNLPEAKALWTELTDSIGGFISQSATARNEVLQTWKDLGGRKDLIDGFRAAFSAIGDVIKPIHDAFRQIFPATTGKELADMTENFRKFAESMKIDPATADGIKRTFAGVFAVFHIAKEVIGGVIGVILDLLGVLGEGSGGFLEFTGGIGDFLVAIDDALTKGGALEGFFEGLGAILKVPLDLIKALARAIAHIFGGDNANAGKEFEDTLQGVNDKLGPMKKIIDLLVEGWDAMVDALGRVKDALEPWFSEMGEKLKGIGDVLANVFEDMDYDKVMEGLETGFVAGIFLMLKKALGDQGMIGELSGSLEGINGILGGLTSTLEAMQSKIQAQALLAIAGGILALSGGLFILSKIDGEDLERALMASAVGLGQLMGAMKLMTVGMGKTGVAQLPIIAAGLIGLAIAATLLAGALKIFSTMDWEEIGKGLAGVGGSIGAIAAAMKFMPKTLPLTAAGLILMGVALNLIAASLKTFGEMKLEEIGKGVFAIVEAIAGIALAVSMLPPNLPLAAAGLILMGVALSAIGGAIKSMGSMDFETLIKGLGGVMAAIAGIGAAMLLVPPNIAMTAVGLLILGNAMVVTAGAIALLGSLSIGTLLKGLIAMGAALLIFAGGLYLMTGTVAGSAALLGAAAALAVLAPTLAFLGNLKWSTIGKGLVAIAGLLVTIGIAGLIAAPALAAIGIALIPLGIGFLMVAAAAKMFASAVSVLSTEGQKGFGTFLTALTGFVAAMPILIITFIKGLLSIVDEITKLAPKVVAALTQVLEIVIKYLDENLPKLAVLFGKLVDVIVTIMTENAPKLMDMGVKLVHMLLDGVSQNVGEITTKAGDILIKFMDALNAKMPAIIDSGVKLLRTFLGGISSRFSELSETADDMIEKFALAVAEHAARFATIGYDMMMTFIEGVTEKIPELAAKGKDFILAFIKGIADNINEVVKQGGKLIVKFIEGIGDNMTDIAEKGADAVITFLNEMAAVIREKDDELWQAGFNVADALLEGMWDGIDQLGEKIVDKLGKFIKLIPKKAQKLLGIKSPSTVFWGIGKFTMLGLQKGIEDNSDAPAEAAEDTGLMMINVLKRTFDMHSPSKVMWEMGRDINRGFAEGLKGSASEVTGAFASLNEKLKDQIRSTKETLATEQGKLAELLKASKPDYEAIAAQRKVVEDNEKILARSRNARAELIGSLSVQKKAMIGLKKEYEDLQKQLDKARSDLQQAEADLVNAKKSYAEKYGGTPDFGEFTEDKNPNQVLWEYEKALENRIDATKKYAVTLAKLRELKLDDTTYKKLVDMGVDGQKFAETLLAGGKAAVDGINELDAQLMAEATKLADTAATELYTAGVTAAQGVIEGLKSQEKALEAQMKSLAKIIISVIRRELKIKSPSRVLLEIGMQTMAGMSKGIKMGGETAEKDMAVTANNIALSARDSLAAAFEGAADIDPTITPVLDLSVVEKEARRLGDLTNVTPITAAASYQQAAAISSAQLTASEAAEAANAVPIGPSVKFEQNNYSPEALSEVEIYRRTNNQMSQLKAVLGL